MTDLTFTIQMQGGERVQQQTSAVGTGMAKMGDSAAAGGSKVAAAGREAAKGGEVAGASGKNWNELREQLTKVGGTAGGMLGSLKGSFAGVGIAVAGLAAAVKPAFDRLVEEMDRPAKAAETMARAMAGARDAIGAAMKAQGDAALGTLAGEKESMGALAAAGGDGAIEAATKFAADNAQDRNAVMRQSAVGLNAGLNSDQVQRGLEAAQVLSSQGRMGFEEAAGKAFGAKDLTADAHEIAAGVLNGPGSIMPALAPGAYEAARDAQQAELDTARRQRIDDTTARMVRGAPGMVPSGAMPGGTFTDRGMSAIHPQGKAMSREQFEQQEREKFAAANPQRVTADQLRAGSERMRGTSSIQAARDAADTMAEQVALDAERAAEVGTGAAAANAGRRNMERNSPGVTAFEVTRKQLQDDLDFKRASYGVARDQMEDADPLVNPISGTAGRLFHGSRAVAKGIGIRDAELKLDAHVEAGRQSGIYGQPTEAGQAETNTILRRIADGLGAGLTTAGGD